MDIGLSYDEISLLNELATREVHEAEDHLYHYKRKLESDPDSVPPLLVDDVRGRLAAALSSREKLLAGIKHELASRHRRY